MTDAPKSIFELVVDEAKANPVFMQLRSSPTSVACRWMMDDIYQTFFDADGNFLEQLQTTGFDARVFEFYLYAYFLRTRLLVERSEAVPDFLVQSGGLTVAVEATTVNPSTSGVLGKLGRKIGDLTSAEIAAYGRHELAVRYGSPLLSKLRKRYWELPDCKGRPLVLAIQAFHDDDSLGMGDSALASYLLGYVADATRNEAGNLLVEFNRIHSHQVGEKEIPSAFFNQPETEHISAVLFSNSGTIAKFSRMGFQSGQGNDSLFIRRRGFALNHLADAADPSLFSYSLDDPPLVESWGQGLVVIHNPNCLHPVPQEFFPDAAQTYLGEDGPHTFTQSWHPFSSKTTILHGGKAREVYLQLSGGAQQVAVEAISKDHFQAAVRRFAGPPGWKEHGWYADLSDGFRGVIILDQTRDTWSWVVFGRDQFFDFQPIASEDSLSSRFDALTHLYQQIEAVARSPQRIFHR